MSSLSYLSIVPAILFISHHYLISFIRFVVFAFNRFFFSAAIPGPAIIFSELASSYCKSLVHLEFTQVTPEPYTHMEISTPLGQKASEELFPL